MRQRRETTSSSLSLCLYSTRQVQPNIAKYLLLGLLCSLTAWLLNEGLWLLQVVKEALYDAFYKLTDSKSQVSAAANMHKCIHDAALIYSCWGWCLDNVDNIV